MLAAQDDSLNLRCFDQKRRFGLDFLYSILRYTQGLRSQSVLTRDGTGVQNPLFAASDTYPDATPRTDSSRVFLAGIVGVPWQDVATDEALSDPTVMAYLDADEIDTRGIWDDILGDPTASPPVRPLDPFMIESEAPREGTNPRTNVAITPPQTGPGGNPINGHEVSNGNYGDLQYACIFPLATPRDCSVAQPGQGCDCKVAANPENRPLCDGTTQLYAKAYPATRILQVLEAYGS